MKRGAVVKGYTLNRAELCALLMQYPFSDTACKGSAATMFLQAVLRLTRWQRFAGATQSLTEGGF